MVIVMQGVGGELLKKKYGISTKMKFSLTKKQSKDNWLKYHLHILIDFPPAVFTVLKVF